MNTEYTIKLKWFFFPPIIRKLIGVELLAGTCGYLWGGLAASMNSNHANWEQADAIASIIPGMIYLGGTIGIITLAIWFMTVQDYELKKFRQ